MNEEQREQKIICDLCKKETEEPKTIVVCKECFEKIEKDTKKNG